MESKEKKELERQVAVLTGRRESRFRRIQRVYDLIKELQDPNVLKQFQTLYVKVEETVAELAEITDRLNELHLRLDPKAAVDYQVLDAVEDMWCGIRQAAQGSKVESAVVVAKPDDSVPLAQLPKIELPVFSGDPASWPLFYDTFKSLIHNNRRLDNIAKVYYLMGALKGRALEVCAGMAPTASNYPIIWANLVKRYQNNRLLADTYFQTMKDFRPLTGESADGLHRLAESFSSAFKALQQLTIPDLADFFAASLALSKLDPSTRKAFEMSNHAEVPTLDEVITFIQRQAAVLTQLKTLNSGRKVAPTSPALTPGHGRATPKSPHTFLAQAGEPSTPAVENSRPCPICRGPHQIYLCEVFAKAPIDSRWKMIQKRKLCYNCLGEFHTLPECSSSHACRSCQKRHHTLLHRDPARKEQPGERDSAGSSPPRQPTDAAQSLVAIHPPPRLRRPTVVLPTAVVRIAAPKGEFDVRFLVDSGSQAQLISLRCVRRLGLSLRESPRTLGGIGGLSAKIRGAVNFIIASRQRPTIQLEIDALVLQRITSQLSPVPLGVSGRERFAGLPLADPAFDQPGEVDGVLGAEIFAQILNSSPPVKGPEGPTAVPTDLGYIIMGSTNLTPAPVSNISPTHLHTLCTFSEPRLEDLVQRFFELESVDSPSVYSGPQDECERRFQTTTTRTEEGRFRVELPFVEFPPPLGDSFAVARRRLFSLERQLGRSPNILQKYRAGITDLLLQGHASRVASSDDQEGYFLPHFAVFKESSTTPVRIVFDASCKTTNGRSLNDVLLTGPKLQVDLQDVLLRFRVHSIAVIADLRQMYRNIEVSPQHRRYQRFLWRDRVEDATQIFQLNCVPFGLNCAPFLALRTVKQLAEEEKGRCPIASRIATQDMYVDDVVTSIPEDEIGDAIPQLLALFRAGGFTLTKWSTNRPDCLHSLPPGDRNAEYRPLDKGEELQTGVKVLGLNWDAQGDTFFFSYRPREGVGTKRYLLSTLARIWDPLGFVAPLTLLCKHLVKQLWIAKCGWDDPPPEPIRREWSRIGKELPHLARISIPRYPGRTQDPSTLLAGFADSSEVGYGAVIYLICRREPEETTSTMLLAKSRVTPMKPCTIPRLELCAALLLAKLVARARAAFPHLTPSQCFAFSDSEDVLHWLSKPPGTWKTFVANRVAQIHELLAAERWFHVPGKENIADCISRGLTPFDLVNHPTWVAGPAWLTQPLENWPVRKIQGSNKAPLELKPAVVAVATTPGPDSPILTLITRISSFSRLCNIVVYLLRLGQVLPRRDRILASDIEVAERRLIQVVQQEHFAQEIRLLAQGKILPKPLQSLQPFNDQGILRVGGRLHHSTLPFGQKHPVLLPKRCHFVDLLVDYFHKLHLHAGPELLGSLLRRRYWIVSARSVIRRRVHLCNRCFRSRPRNDPPLMAPLPAERVTATRAFNTTGVDYAGPFQVTMGRYRGVRSQKAYVCLFVCFTTRALHLELAADLSTAAFLQCFRRFFARRGPISTMFSDCGTNFVGAKAQLEQYPQLLESPEFKTAFGEACREHRIEWRFNPPAAPHFGGLWESGVKSVKRHLHRVMGLQILSWDEFYTLLTQIEALLNSRPLCVLSADPTCPEALTPAHFLNLAPLSSLPLVDPPDKQISLTNRKGLLDHMLQGFWERWHREYLNTLQPRKKWATPAEPLRVGTVVVVREENSPPLRWPLGIVEEVFPGSDGIIRVARVKVGTTSLRRPVVKLFALPLQ